MHDKISTSCVLFCHMQPRKVYLVESNVHRSLLNMTSVPQGKRDIIGKRTLTLKELCSAAVIKAFGNKAFFLVHV